MSTRLESRESPPMRARDHLPEIAPGASAPGTLVRIRPSSGWSIPNLREVWDRRELLLNLANRDVKLRYKQTALGIAWVILQPLLPAVIFAFVFGLVVRVSTGTVPYILFVFSGFMTWNLIQRVTLQAGSSLIVNAQLISKTYFPRILLPLAAVPVALLDFLIALGLMAGLMLIYRAPPGPGLLLLPVWIGLLLVLVLGIGLIAASLAVRYRDVQHALPILMPMLMYLSPIAYPATMVPARWQPFYNLNPLVSALEAVRWSVLGIGELHWANLSYTAAVAAVALVAGLISIKRVEGKIADVI